VIVMVQLGQVVQIAAWRMTIAAGHRFEAKALRQVLSRAVAWGMNRRVGALRCDHHDRERASILSLT
jgi:hypothetical protein